LSTMGQYWVATSSCETESCATDGLVAFTRNDWIVGGLFTNSVKNVSLAFYRGKLRAALAYDTWSDHFDGCAFLPLADGVFKAALKDVNDLEVFRNNMHTSLTQMWHRWLFDGMTEAQLQQMESANHVQLPRNPRPLPEQYNYTWDPEHPPWIVTCEPEETE